MAGDWIPMRLDLPEDPAVIGISTRLDIEEDLVVGKLHRIWSWASRQTRDGNAPCVTAKWIDRFMCAPGFAQAMADVGWLELLENGVRFPLFERHMAESAKNRALTARRVARHRAAKCNGNSVTKALPEKRTEEKSIITPFPPCLQTDRFATAWADWKAYKCERSEPYKPRGEKAALARLEELGEIRAIAAIRHSMAQNFAGIYEPKPGDNVGPEVAVAAFKRDFDRAGTEADRIRRECVDTAAPVEETREALKQARKALCNGSPKKE